MELTEEEKKKGIQRIKEGFEDIENFMLVLKRNIDSEDQNTQLSAVFISTELIKMIAKFHAEILRLSELKTEIALPKSNLYIPKGKQKKWK